jgi:hypothetical protein
MKLWIKAGVLGGVLQIIFTLPILLFYALPVGIGSLFSLCVCCFFFLIYPVPGILVAHWLPAPRETGQIVRSGALAGLLATGIDSLATLLLVLGLSLTGITERYIERIMPNAMEILQQSGMEFWFSTGGQLLQTSFYLIFHIITGILLSILGGVIYTGIRKE